MFFFSFLTSQNNHSELRWGNRLEQLCEDMVKFRTCIVNYAPLYAVMEFVVEYFRWAGIFSPSENQISIARELYARLGYGWDRFEDFLFHHHIPAIQAFHVEAGTGSKYITSELNCHCQTTLKLTSSGS